MSSPSYKSPQAKSIPPHVEKAYWEAFYWLTESVDGFVLDSDIELVLQNALRELRQIALRRAAPRN